MEEHRRHMLLAIDTAKTSKGHGDYAIGAVVVRSDKIIGFGETMLKRSSDPTLHAEIVAIRNACTAVGSRYLEGAMLYTTHEPCPMCASAAIWARMRGIVFGATIDDAKKHATDVFSWRQIDMKCRDVLAAGNPKLELVEEYMREDCNELFD